MIQIAFCDDDQTVLDQLSALLEKYRAQRCVQIQCTAFRSPLDLLAEIEKGTRYDILFLDVIMPAENGITAAKEIRQYDNVVKIIFLTSSAEFAVESYVVGAYFYQLKPIWEDSFFRLTDFGDRRVPPRRPAQPDPALQDRHLPHRSGPAALLRSSGPHCWSLRCSRQAAPRCRMPPSWSSPCRCCWHWCTGSRLRCARCRTLRSSCSCSSAWTAAQAFTALKSPAPCSA